MGTCHALQKETRNTDQSHNDEAMQSITQKNSQSPKITNDTDTSAPTQSIKIDEVDYLPKMSKLHDRKVCIIGAGPLTHSQMRAHKTSKTWPLISNRKQTFLELAIDETNPEFYKNELNLSYADITTHFKERNVVLPHYHNRNGSLGEMEHCFIYLYYSIKDHSIEQLQQLWMKLYKLFANKNKLYKNGYMPTIYIDFKTGEKPTNVNNIFSLLRSDITSDTSTVIEKRDRFGIDLCKLKEVISHYYYQYNPQSINEIRHESHDKTDVFKIETVDEHRDICGYNSQQFWSISDANIQFPFIESERSLSVEATITSMTKFDDENDPSLFGFVSFVASKTARILNPKR